MFEICSEMDLDANEVRGWKYGRIAAMQDVDTDWANEHKSKGFKINFLLNSQLPAPVQIKKTTLEKSELLKSSYRFSDGLFEKFGWKWFYRIQYDELKPNQWGVRSNEIQILVAEDEVFFLSDPDDKKIGVAICLQPIVDRQFKVEITENKFNKIQAAYKNRWEEIAINEN